MAMTTVDQRRAGGVHARQSAARPHRAGFAAAIRSEITKIRSVRSTYWTLLVLIVICVGVGVLYSYGQAAQVTGAFGAHNHAAALAQARDRNVTGSLIGLLIGQLVIAVLGALTITSEYSTGMIRTSLATMPRRGTIFAAKAVVFGFVALGVGLITSFLAFFAGQAMLAGVHAGASLSQPGVLRAVIGGGLFLAVCGLLSFGIGGMLRHTAGAITAAVGLLFVSWTLSGFLPSPPSGWFGQADIDKWIPLNAGGAIWEHVTGVNMFSPWIGFVVFCCYAAAALIAGLIVFVMRDA